MKKLNKKQVGILVATIIVVVSTITVVALASTKNNDESVDNTTQSTTLEQTTEPTTIEETTEPTTIENTTEENVEQKGEETTQEITKAKETTTKKKVVKQETTTKKTQPKPTPQPQTTTTTQPVKHITPQEVQNEVNAYIRSKGITVDPTLKPIDHGGDAGYYCPTASLQEDLDSGLTLKHCKEDVDWNILQGNENCTMYCYLETRSPGHYMFYLLYF